MAELTLGLVVLRTDQVEAVLAFYRALGLHFVEEKHGSGRLHHSCQLGSIVLEIYPATTQPPCDNRGGGSTLLGFNVVSLDMILAALEGKDALLTLPKMTTWGRRAVVVDPDGRAIELLEPLPLSTALPQEPGEI